MSANTTHSAARDDDSNCELDLITAQFEQQVDRQPPADAAAFRHRCQECIAAHPRWASELARYFKDRELGGILGVGTLETSLPQVPNFEILEKLGEGAMGVVYKARDLRLNRLVALKMISGGHFGTTKLERLRKEANAVAGLHHPNLVQIFGIEECDGQPALVLEYVPGGTLALSG